MSKKQKIKPIRRKKVKLAENMLFFGIAMVIAPWLAQLIMQDNWGAMGIIVSGLGLFISILGGYWYVRECRCPHCDHFIGRFGRPPEKGQGKTHCPLCHKPISYIDQ